MCDWEEFLFICGHSVLRKKSYCHFARNEPTHKCARVRVLRNCWVQEGTLCDDCINEGFRIHNGVIWQVSPGAS